MKRLYHRTSSYLPFFSQHRKLVIACVFLFFFLIYIGPLLPYLWRTLHFTKEFIVPTEDVKNTDGKTNILLLGIDTRNKNTEDALTDTILFTSVNPNQNKAVMVSIPRDLWIEEIQAKINKAYILGNQEDGVGIDWTKRYVEEVTGQPIHYAVVISFDGFIKIIDLLGGVDVMVDRSFVDEKYPIPGKEDDFCSGDPQTKCRYETLIFNKGLTHMDGAMALKFARSRHAQGEEGSDFARSARQQKIILAVREKVLSTDVLLNPKKASQVLSAIEGSIETDAPESQYAALTKLALAAKETKINSHVIDFVPDKSSLLKNPPIGPKYFNAYVLIPKDQSWGEIHNWISCLLTQETCPVDEFTAQISAQKSTH